MTVVVADAFWQEFDNAWEALHHAGRDAAGFHEDIVEALRGLEDLPRRHPYTLKGEDPLQLGLRAVRRGSWRMVFLVVDDTMRVLGLRHVRGQTKPVQP